MQASETRCDAMRTNIAENSFLVEHMVELFQSQNIGFFQNFTSKKFSAGPVSYEPYSSKRTGAERLQEIEIGRTPQLFGYDTGPPQMQHIVVLAIGEFAD